MSPEQTTRMPGGITTQLMQLAMGSLKVGTLTAAKKGKDPSPATKCLAERILQGFLTQHEHKGGCAQTSMSLRCGSRPLAARSLREDLQNGTAKDRKLFPEQLDKPKEATAHGMAGAEALFVFGGSPATAPTQSRQHPFGPPRNKRN